MTQNEIISNAFDVYNDERRNASDFRDFPERKDFIAGAKFAFTWAYREFSEMMAEHFGDDEQYQDEKDFLLADFETRIGII